MPGRDSRLSGRGRQAALAAQAEADAVRRALVSLAGAAEEAAYRQGQEAQREGDVHLAAEAFEPAAAAYATARGRFQQASASCQRRRAEEARARAVQAGERFPKDFAKTLDGLARGVAAEEAGAYVSAAEAYAEAAERWSRLEEDAQGLLAQEQAGAARERLAVARTQGAALRAWAGKAWAGADQSAQEAERAWQEQRYAEAIGLYEWALRAYTEAGAAAEAARDEHEAVEARTQAEQSESAARAAGAPQLAQARFAKATSAHQEGTRDLQNRHWEVARRHYAEAHRLYLEARDEAEGARARAAAEAALEGARAARAALQQAAAPKTIAARIEQAEALFAEAQTALGREHWEDARAGFDTSATRFRQLCEEAIVHQAREGAVQARAQALRLQRDIGPAGGWRMARAKGALAHGHRLFEAANYAEAKASFEKAASRFEARLQAAARQKREPRFAVPWAKVLPFVGLGALAAGAVLSDTTGRDVHLFPGGTNVQTRAIDDDATGVGDLLLRTKYHFLNTNGFNLAGGLSLRLPTGDEDDFQGLNDVILTPYLALSQEWGRFDFHFQAGFDVNADDTERSRARYGIGLTTQLVERVAFLIDIIGSSNLTEQDISVTIPVIVGSAEVGSQTITQGLRTDIVDLAVGFKAAFAQSVVGFAAVFLPLNDDGLRQESHPQTDEDLA
jgi:hypothetical protein